MAQHFPTLKPKSAQRYGVSLGWLSDKFENSFIDEISRQALSELEEDRRATGVTSSTIRRDFACLSSLLAFCEDKDWIEEGKNPVPSYLRRRAKRGLKEGQPRKRWLRHNEEKVMLDLAGARKFSKGRLREAMMLAIDTGLREEEQFSLRWPQVDLGGGMIFTTRDTKNGRSRAVPLPERSAQFLAQWKEENRRRKVPSLYVFSKENGERYKNLYRGFKALAAEAGMPELWWHDLRRTAGCRWLRDYKKQIHEVSVLLGHSSVVVTERSYAFLEQEVLAQETSAQIPAHMQTVSGAK
jgi:integrase